MSLYLGIRKKNTTSLSLSFEGLRIEYNLLTGILSNIIMTTKTVLSRCFKGLINLYGCAENPSISSKY